MSKLKFVIPILTAVLGYVLGNIYIYQDIKNLIFGHEAPAEIRGIWNTNDGSVAFIDVSDSKIEWRYLTQQGKYDHKFEGYWEGSTENGQIVGTMERTQTSPSNGVPCVLPYRVKMTYQSSENTLGVQLDPEVDKGEIKCGVREPEQNVVWTR